MNRQTHIVSFDDAKRSRRSFVSESGSEWGSRGESGRGARTRQGAGRRSSDAPGAAGRPTAGTRAGARDAMRPGREAGRGAARPADISGVGATLGSVVGRASRDASSVGAAAGRSSRGSLPGGRETFRYDGLRDEVRVLDGGSPARGTRSRGAVPAAARGAASSLVAEGRRPRGASAEARVARRDAGEAAAEDYLERTRARRDTRDEGVEDEPPAKRGLMGRLSKARRSASKAKADREFTRRYGDDKPSAAESGPRAAVYETQMGRQHKRAARLQDGRDGARRSSAPSRPSDKREAGSARNRLVTLGAVAVCLLLTCVFLYPPAQQYYQEVRERDRLQAEYDAIQQRNDAIQREVDYLSADAGVQDKARAEFGWVREGERSVSVTGIDVPDESRFTANIVAGEIPAPETWYSFLDPLFGVS